MLMSRKILNAMGRQARPRRPSRIRQRRSSMQLLLTAVFERVSEGYIGYVEELPGANTQAATLEEARENLVEAVQMVLDANRRLAEERLAGREVIREPLRITG